MKKKAGKFCKICGREFSSEVDFCPDDESKLVGLEDEACKYIGRIIDNRYRIEDIIGKGGFGSIYKAYQFSMDRFVALKILTRDIASDSSLVVRFLREAKAVAKLTNPNTITIYDSARTEDGILYMAMELLEGDLLTRLICRGSISLEKTVDIATQICNSLSEAHGNGIVHRDLKPDNIFIVQKEGFLNHVKVLDFGIAKIMTEGESEPSRLTRTGLVFGTAEYMSPEQAMGLDDIDHRTDIYSLGIIIYEMLTGSTPFSGSTPMQILNRHATERPAPIRQVNPDIQVPVKIDDLIIQCLEKEPDNRPLSAVVLKEHLAAYSKDIREKKRISSIFTGEHIVTAERIRELQGKFREPLATRPSKSLKSGLSQETAKKKVKAPSITEEDYTERGRPSQERFLESEVIKSNISGAELDLAETTQRPRSDSQAIVDEELFEKTEQSPYDGRYRKLMYINFFAIIGLLIFFGLFLLKRQKSGEGPGYVPQSMAIQWFDYSEASRNRVEFLISSLPRGASVFNKETGELEGKTDFRMMMAKAAKRLALIVRLEGYEAETIQLDLGSLDRDIQVKLKKKGAGLPETEEKKPLAKVKAKTAGETLTKLVTRPVTKPVTRLVTKPVTKPVLPKDPKAVNKGNIHDVKL